MGIYPKIKTNTALLSKKQCCVCGRAKELGDFVPVRSEFFPDGYSHICSACMEEILKSHDYDWEYIDQACQTFSIPWVPTAWEEIMEIHTAHPFSTYALKFMDKQYADFGWKEYYKRFCELKDEDMLQKELPRLAEEERRRQRELWGSRYDDEQLDYLDSLYKGLTTTHSVNGALQTDQAIKLCRLSLQIDEDLEEGKDIKNLLASYDKLIEEANFTPQNIKNLSEFDSCGELIKWLEKKGWKNNYYDDVKRDVIDETIQNIQAYNQRLYTNEPGIGDEITRRIEALKEIETEDRYDLMQSDQAINDYDMHSGDDLFGNFEEDEEDGIAERSSTT